MVLCGVPDRARRGETGEVSQKRPDPPYEEPLPSIIT